ncbi:MAG TPA: hypothetical protein VFE63_17890 [Roseiarcus sp.]|nr:hypothetical protein [Roseiarcus sp.]
MRHLTRRLNPARNLLQPLVQPPVQGRSRNGRLQGGPPFVVGGRSSISVGWRSSIDALTRSFQHACNCFEHPLQALLAAPYPAFDPRDRRLEKILGFIKPGMSGLLGSARENVVAAFVQIISGDPSDDGLVEPFIET